jgi:hypothetical protein
LPTFFGLEKIQGIKELSGVLSKLGCLFHFDMEINASWLFERNMVSLRALNFFLKL